MVLWKKLPLGWSCADQAFYPCVAGTTAAEDAGFIRMYEYFLHGYTLCHYIIIIKFLNNNHFCYVSERKHETCKDEHLGHKIGARLYYVCQ